jgi:hypothetical protein
MKSTPPATGEGPPASVWQRRAQQWIDRAERTLWSRAGRRARQWLEARGLTEETIRYWRLGLVAQDTYEPSGQWGLADGKRVWLPRGILIPALAGNNVWYLNIRRPIGTPKYVKVKGSRAALFGDLTGHDVCLITEGEFDAIVLIHSPYLKLGIFV